MSDAIQQFIAMTRKAVVDLRAIKNQPLPANTFVCFCPQCREMTPHDETPLGWRCIFHYSHQKPLLSENGYISQEFARTLNWIVIVLAMLFLVCRNWLW
jgi:hypothetical protein